MHEKKLNELRLKEIKKIQEDMKKKKIETQREQKYIKEKEQRESLEARSLKPAWST